MKEVFGPHSRYFGEVGDELFRIQENQKQGIFLDFLSPVDRLLFWFNTINKSISLEAIFRYRAD